MFLKKSCPRCCGDLTLVFDIDESYFSCMQCGHISYERPHAVHAPPPRIREREESREGHGAPVGSGHDRGTHRPRPARAG
jgi:ribosomal protein S27AE